MRPVELDAPVEGRSGSRAVRVAVATLAVGVVATGLAHLGTSTSAAAPAPVGGTDAAAVGNRGTSVSRTSDRAAQTVQALAQTRANALDATADALATSREQSALATRTEALGKAAAQISEQSDMLKDQSSFLRPTAGKFGSGFGMRLHPILHYYRMHNGQDIGGACGQPIWAAQDGKVTKVVPTGYNGGSGHNVKINGGQVDGVKLETAYLHMQKIVVKVGQKVHKGELLGTVGNTGISTACHLHFSVYRDGRAVDPTTYLGR